MSNGEGIRNADSITVEDFERSLINLSRGAIEGNLIVEEVIGGIFTVVKAGVQILKNLY